ncbi:MAG: DUF2520 domain-containing protein [Novosphingobium sp.]
MMTVEPIAERIGIVGTGRVARAFALGLRSHSRSAPLVWGRDPARAEDVVAQVGGCLTAPSLRTLAGACDIIIIAVADDAIVSVAAELAQEHLPGTQFICHLSGGSGIAPLSCLQGTETLTAAVHPAMTFTGDPRREVALMRQAHFAVTGSSPGATTVGMTLVRALGGVGVAVPEGHRPLYHAALCHAANHLVTLIAGSGDALKLAGIDDPGAFLAPLVRAALENSLNRSMAALSGPVLRGDTGTIASHLGAIATNAPGLMPPYRAMALATLKALGDRRPGPGDELERLLMDDRL